MLQLRVMHGLFESPLEVSQEVFGKKSVKDALGQEGAQHRI